MRCSQTVLRGMMTDPRIADPKKFAHIRQELGIDPVSADDEVPLLLAFCTVATVPWSDIYSDRRPNEILCH